MPPEARDPASLWDMLRACRHVIAFTKDKTEEQYMRDVFLRSAVERQVEIIGEAARRLSERFRNEHPEIPWGSIIGQRNILSHRYGSIDDSSIWEVAVVDAPNLILKLEALLPSTGGPEAGE